MGSLNNYVLTFMTMSRWIFLRIRSVSKTFAVKIKIHILGSITLFRKSCRLWHNVEKYGGAREVADMAHVSSNLDKKGYTHASTRLRPRPCTYQHTHTNQHACKHARTLMHAHACNQSRTGACTQPYVILFFHGNNAFVKSPQYYVTRTEPDLLASVLVRRI